LVAVTPTVTPPPYFPMQKLLIQSNRLIDAGRVFMKKGARRMDDRLKALTAILLLALAGCVTTAPVRTADGTWMVSARVPFSGQSGALNQAISEANTLCASKGEVVKLLSNTSQECALHGGCGEARITFTCAKASP
jgi:hypothetical protein